MKSICENPQRNILKRNDFQESLDFFYDEYLDFFPKHEFDNYVLGK